MPFCSFINIKIYKKYLEPKVSSSVLFKLFNDFICKILDFFRRYAGNQHLLLIIINKYFYPVSDHKEHKASPSGT